MRNSIPFLGGKLVSFKEAYPGVEDIKVTYTESESVYENGPDRQGPVIMSGVDRMVGTIPCCCKRCNNGGCRIEIFLMSMVQSKMTVYDGRGRCSGYTTKRTKEPCQNYFEFTIEITYKDVEVAP